MSCRCYRSLTLLAVVWVDCAISWSYSPTLCNLSLYSPNFKHRHFNFNMIDIECNNLYHLFLLLSKQVLSKPLSQCHHLLRDLGPNHVAVLIPICTGLRLIMDVTIKWHSYICYILLQTIEIVDLCAYMN